MSTSASSPAKKNKTLAPTPKEHWLLGSAYYMSRDPLNFLKKNIQAYNGVFRVTSPFVKLMVVNEPEYIKYVLQDNNRNYHKSFGYKVLGLLLGNGLLTSEGEFWKKQRRLAQPAFHRERLALLVDTMVDCVKEADEHLAPHTNGETVDIAKEMMAATLNIVARSMFSSDVKEFIDIVGHEIEQANNFAINRINHPLTPPHWVPTPQNLRERRSIANLDKVMHAIIDGRRKTTERYDDLMAMLMEAVDEETGERMSDLQLRDEAMTIFLAGHETTAVGMSWLWYLLDKNPAEQQKLFDEVDTVLQGRTPTLEDLQHLPFTKLVVDESMRLYPPAWIIGRKNIEDDEIGGYHIPKGNNITIPVVTIHRDPRIWEDPDTFKPERFKKENLKDKHRYAYFPFGGGQRQCIGNNFALMEMQLLTAMLAQKYRFKLVPGFEPEMDLLITLRPKGGMLMTVEKR